MSSADVVVRGFGRDANGELGGDDNTLAASPVRSVAAGLFHSLSVTHSGDLLTWGAGSGGQLAPSEGGDLTKTFGQCTTRAWAHLRKSQCRTGKVGIHCRWAQSHARRGKLGFDVFLGRAAHGQLGHGDATEADATRRIASVDLETPMQIEGLQRVAQAEAGEHFSAALTRDGAVFTWGCNANGQLGRSASGSELAEPRCVPWPHDIGIPPPQQAITRLALGWSHAMAVNAAGQLFTWGAGAAGQLGRGARKDAEKPALVEALGRERVTAVAAGRAHSLATTAGGLTFAWGDNSSAQCGSSHEAYLVRPQALMSLLDYAPFATLSAGAAHSAFVARNGRLFTCGDDSYGQLCAPRLASAGENDGAAAPRMVDLKSLVKGAACGAWHTVLLLAAEPIASYSDGGRAAYMASTDGASPTQDLDPLSSQHAEEMQVDRDA